MVLNLTISNHNITKLELELGGKYSFNLERRNALINSDDVQACPGSGKTTMVAAKLILLSKKWGEKYKGICVITHTNVAKDEIIKLLIKHPSGHKLLTFPHFVGTIQEFVDKFLGIPFSKTQGWEVRLFSSEEFAIIVSTYRWRQFVDKKNPRKRYWFTYYVNSKRINLGNFTYSFRNDALSINEGFMNSVNACIDLKASSSPSIVNLRIETF